MSDSDLRSVTVPLGRVTIDLPELPFRLLKKVLPRLNRLAPAAARGDLAESDLDEMLEVIAISSGREVAELEALPIKVHELAGAIAALVEVNGLRAAEGKGPNPEAATEPMGSISGTASTPSSPPQPAGPGTESTA